jgi:hypothetical protein
MMSSIKRVIHSFRRIYAATRPLALNFCTHKPHSYKSIEFGGGGIFFWWYAGAALYLSELAYLKSIPLVGASAGAVAATMLALDSPINSAPEVAVRIALEYKIDKSRTGLLGVFGRIAKEFLEELIPSRVDEEQLRRLNIVVTPRMLGNGPAVLTGFHSKEDAISAVMASIHIPVVMNGELWATYREQKYVDGTFWTLLNRARVAWRVFPPEAPLPHTVGALTVDYKYDAVFLRRYGGTPIMKMVQPQDLHVMMDYGYDYMRRMDAKLNFQQCFHSAL